MTSNREQLLTNLGFRFGINGPHAARTMMFADIEAVFERLPPEASRADYAREIVDLNCLGKPTKNARTLALRHLTALYGLDTKLAVFRTLRRFWVLAPEERPLLALATAVARDPLLRVSGPLILGKKVGETVARQDVEQLLAGRFTDRFSPSSLKSFAQNIGGTWTQAGYLQGKMHKTRHQPDVGPASVAFCLFLGFLEGQSGQRLFATAWMKLLDRPLDTLETLATAAAHRDWVRYLQAGGVKELSFPKFLTPEEERMRQEAMHVV